MRLSPGPIAKRMRTSADCPQGPFLPLDLYALQFSSLKKSLLSEPSGAAIVALARSFNLRAWRELWRAAAQPKRAMPLRSLPARGGLTAEEYRWKLIREFLKA